MAWFMLMIAGGCEVAFTAFLKLAQGFTRLGPSLAFVLFYAASAWFLSLAVRSIPIGTAYAVWTGIGAVGATLLGALAFGEAITPARLGFISLIVIGVAGLRITSQA